MTDPINPRGYAAAYEQADCPCQACDGDGRVWRGWTCAVCNGTGIEPAPDAKPVTSEDVERALSRAEEKR